MDSATKMRVKVYRLSAGNQWIDHGTGHCSCEFNMDKSEGTLIVQSEDEDDKVLLRSRIRVGEDLYHRQQETLIVWSEVDGEDLALSFQEAEGCAEIWDSINEVQQHYAEDLFSDPSDVNGAGSGEFITLPDPDISNLAEIETLIKEAQIAPNEKEKLAAFIILDNYIDKLFPIFETCEDLESLSDLHLLHGIMLGIILLSDIAIIQYILKDEILIRCLGILEYDPTLGGQKENYREFLTTRSKFKQIVPINDQEVEQKIHQTFRLHFLRDTVLARIVDDSLSSILGSLIFFHNIDIVNYIHHDRAFMKELFGILENEAEPIERKRDVVLFVQQFCSIAKTTQLHARVGLFRTLGQHGLFSVFEVALSDSNPNIKMAGTEILLSAMEHDPTLIRIHITKQADEKAPRQLMDIILDQFVAEEDMGVRLQYSEVIRMLLDTNTSQAESGMLTSMDSMPSHDPDSERFLDLFYGTYVGRFASPLLELSEDTTVFPRPLATLCENTCQILSFMVRQHSFRSKYFVLSSGIIGKVCLLLRNRDQHLRLFALRFFRTCIGTSDDFYLRYIVKQNTMRHIVDALLSTHNKNNLLNSACIEFFDYIRSENITLLINHIVPLYGEKLKSIEYVNTFKALIRRYEHLQNLSVAGSEAAEAAVSETSSAKRGGPGQQGWSSSTVDDDEEAYFNNSDDEDEVPDEGKHEDNPPASDLRRRVKEDSDEDSDQDEHRKAGSSDVRMDMATEPVLASQNSPPRPPLLLRRKLVDYGDDDDEDGDEGVFGRQAKAQARNADSIASPPPEKKIKLDTEATEGSTQQQDHVMEDSAVVQEGGSTPIKFKLNKIKNGRSPSPLSSGGARPRSVSPLGSSGAGLPPVPMRTSIAFVRAGSADSEGSSQGSDSEGGKAVSGGDGNKDSATEAATNLKSDMALDFKHTGDNEDEDERTERKGDMAEGDHAADSSGEEAKTLLATESGLEPVAEKEHAT